MNEIALNKFYERLETKRAGYWSVGTAGKIRMSGSGLICACPLAVATGRNSYSAPEALGLTESEGDFIRDAADNCRTDNATVAQIRVRMLSILGLSEVGA